MYWNVNWYTGTDILEKLAESIFRAVQDILQHLWSTEFYNIRMWIKHREGRENLNILDTWSLFLGYSKDDSSKLILKSKKTIIFIRAVLRT